MFEIGDLVRIKEKHLDLFDNPDDLGLVVKIEKNFYKKNIGGTNSSEIILIDCIQVEGVYEIHDLGFVPANILEKV